MIFFNYSPGQGGMAGTTNLDGTFKSPYAALYIWKAANRAFHSASSDIFFFFGFVSDLDEANSAVPVPAVNLYSFDVNAGYLNSNEDNCEEDDCPCPNDEEDLVGTSMDDDDEFILVENIFDAEKASTWVALHATVTAHAAITNIVWYACVVIALVLLCLPSAL